MIIKKTSEDILSNLGLSTNSKLPEIEIPKSIRSPKEIIDRISALILVALKGEQAPKELFKIIEEQFQGKEHLTPKEKAFFQNEDNVEAELIAATWRYESIWLLLWSISLVEELKLPTDLASLNELISILKSHSREELISKAKLRGTDEILKKVDLHYRMHWACTDARICNREMTIVNPSVVYERLYSLNWLLGYLDAEWDDVQTDS